MMRRSLTVCSVLLATFTLSASASTCGAGSTLPNTANCATCQISASSPALCGESATMLPCDANAVCRTCPEGTVLDDQRDCANTCGVGSTFPNTESCNDCSLHSAKCGGKGDPQCDANAVCGSCPVGTRLINGACSSTCGPNSIIPNTVTCKTCNTSTVGCGEGRKQSACDATSVCVSCPPNTALDPTTNTCEVTCGTGSVFPNTEFCTTCETSAGEPCGGSHEVCDASSVCSACMDGTDPAANGGVCNEPPTCGAGSIVKGTLNCATCMDEGAPCGVPAGPLCTSSATCASCLAAADGVNPDPNDGSCAPNNCDQSLGSKKYCTKCSDAEFRVCDGCVSGHVLSNGDCIRCYCGDGSACTPGSATSPATCGTSSASAALRVSSSTAALLLSTAAFALSLLF